MTAWIVLLLELCATVVHAKHIGAEMLNSNRGRAMWLLRNYSQTEHDFNGIHYYSYSTCCYLSSQPQRLPRS